MSGTQLSLLELIKPQIERAVELVQREPNEQAWPYLLRPVWAEAVSVLIRFAMRLEGRREAAEASAREFLRLDYDQQHEIAAQQGFDMDQFVRIVRTACGFRRSSTRPPPTSSSPPSNIPRHRDADRIGIIIDPRLRKINPR